MTAELSIVMVLILLLLTALIAVVAVTMKGAVPVMVTVAMTWHMLWCVGYSSRFFIAIYVWMQQVQSQAVQGTDAFEARIRVYVQTYLC